MSLDELVSYLSAEHHPYLVQSLSGISPCIQTIENAGTGGADSAALRSLLQQLTTVLHTYLNYENEQFFPGISSLILNQRIENLHALLSKARQLHMKITKIFGEIDTMSEQYTSPEHTSAMVKLCYAQLFNFEQDVLTYILLKEDFLFPLLLKVNKE